MCGACGACAAAAAGRALADDVGRGGVATGGRDGRVAGRRLAGCTWAPCISVPMMRLSFDSLVSHCVGWLGTRLLGA